MSRDGARRSLSRLASSPPPLDAARGGCGPAFTAADVAGAVGFLRQAGRPWSAGQRLVLYLWAGHNSPADRTEVILALHDEVAAEVRAKLKGRLPPRAEFLSLVVMALDELAQEPDRACGTCKGLGFVFDPLTGESTICPVCRGSGRRWLGSRLLSRRMGISYKAWRLHYEAPYRVTRAAVADVESRAISQLSAALRG